MKPDASSTVLQEAEPIFELHLQMLANTSNETEFEFSIEDFELVSKGTQYFLASLYILTATVALVGNILAIVVLTLGKRSSRELRLFLVNLSLADCLMAVFSIPFTYTDFIMGRWVFAPSLCPLVQSMQIVSVFVSVYTMTTIGIDRYIAITRPFIVTLWSKSLAPVIVCFTWLAGFGLSLIVWFCSQAEPFSIKNETYYDCREKWSSHSTEQLYTAALFLVVFAIPLTGLIFFYGSICHKLWHHSAPGNADRVRDNAQNQAKKKVIKMLITIVVMFAVCWLPMHLFQLFRVFCEDTLMAYIGNDASNPRYLIIVISSHWFSMAHSFVNPIIYCFMSDNFRIDVKDMAKKAFQRRLRHNQLENLSAANSVAVRLPPEEDSEEEKLQVLYHPSKIVPDDNQTDKSHIHLNPIEFHFKTKQTHLTTT